MKRHGGAQSMYYYNVHVKEANEKGHRLRDSTSVAFRKKHAR